MDRVWTLCRFIGSVAYYYITPTPPDFELVYAERDGKDITPETIARLAYQHNQVPKEKEESRLLLHYKYKGAGPFAIYFDKGEVFEFPPPRIEPSKPIEFCLVSVEVGEKDITETAGIFAGPDGRWDGRLPKREGKKSQIDPKLLYPDLEQGESILISFANGDEIQLY